jgi:hypothetical protein
VLLDKLSKRNSMANQEAQMAQQRESRLKYFIFDIILIGLGLSALFLPRISDQTNIFDDSRLGLSVMGFIFLGVGLFLFIEDILETRKIKRQIQ